MADESAIVAVPESGWLALLWTTRTWPQRGWFLFSFLAAGWVMDKAVDQSLAGEYALALRLAWLAGVVWVVANLPLLRSIDLEVSALAVAILILGSLAMGALAMYCVAPVIHRHSPAKTSEFPTTTKLPFGFELSEARHFRPDGLMTDGDPFEGTGWHGHKAAFLIGQYDQAQQRGDSVDALKALDELDSTQPSFIYVDYYRLIYLEKLKRPTEAERARKRLKERADIVLKASPAHKYALFVKAVCLLKEDERSASEQVLTQIGPADVGKVMHDFIQFPVVPMVETQPWRTFAEEFLRDHNTGLYEQFLSEHPATGQ